jgi:hypothetical protein
MAPGMKHSPCLPLGLTTALGRSALGGLTGAYTVGDGISLQAWPAIGSNCGDSPWGCIARPITGWRKRGEGAAC